MMDILAYTDAYAAHEEWHGIEYEFEPLNLLTSPKIKSVTHFLLLGMVSTGLILTVLTTADAAMARTLRQGMAGPDVAEVQTLLRNRGFEIRYGANGAGRGLFGPQTDTAVRQFQSQVGLQADGVVGQRTLQALAGGTGGTTPTATRVMRMGARGESVASLQTQLRNRGYTIRYGADGSGRGIYGEQTIAAVKAFQRDAGLTVDGIAGPRTLAALNGTTAPARTAPAVATGGSNLGKYQVATGGRGLNVRTGPGTQYGVATSLANQTVIEVSAMRNGWAQIAPGRFVAANFIRKM